MIDVNNLQRFETSDGKKFDGRNKRVNGKDDPLVYMEIQSDLLSDIVQNFINMDLESNSAARMSYDPKEITYSDILYNTFTALEIIGNPIYKNALIRFDISKSDRVNKVTKDKAGIITSVDPDFANSLVIKIVAFKSDLQNIVKSLYNSYNISTTDIKNAKVHPIWFDHLYFLDSYLGCVYGTPDLDYFKYCDKLLVTNVFDTGSAIEKELKNWDKEFGLLP